MKIGVNLYPLRPRIAGGMEFYVRNLLRTMLELDADNFFYILTAPWNHAELDFGIGPYKKIMIEPSPARFDFARRLKAKIRKRHWNIELCAKELKPDIWFCPMLDLDPRNIDIPSVVTVPDIQHEFFPHFFSADELKHRALTIKPSCQMATTVITISEHSRSTMIEKFGLDKERVHCTYLAAGKEFNPEAARKSWLEVTQRYGLAGGFLFYPANTWPHKNHEMLLMALQRLRKRDLMPKLVLSGAEIGTSDHLKTLAKQLGCDDQLVHLGYVDLRYSPGLYFGAACLVFPSLFEGFGIPLVEAMACGCPVACSNLCSIPEVAGDAALLFDPQCPDSIADAVEKILRDQETRRILIEKGFLQAAKFSWENAARQTLAIFEQTRTRPKPQTTPLQMPQNLVDGFHIDGWASPQVLVSRVEIGRWRTLVLEGETSGNCCPMSIRVYAGSDRLQEFTIDTARPFSKRFDLPRAESTSTLVDIKITANRHFVPKRSGISEDTRKLSYLLRNLALVDVEGNALTLQGRS